MAAVGTGRLTWHDDIMPEWRVLAGGAAGLLVWEVFARLIAPLWIGQPLNPEGLVQAALGVESNALAMVIHVVTGVVAFPVGYVLVARPVARLVLPRLHWAILGAVYGVGLWVFALLVMAHWFAGFPAFLDFQPIAWASLAGHVLFGLALAAVMAWADGRGGLTPRNQSRR